jgi:hypothetical protein
MVALLSRACAGQVGQLGNGIQLFPG